MNIPPVAPDGMELLFFYPCPFCKNRVATLPPFEPGMLKCPKCEKVFPVLPVDAHSIMYVRLMLGEGLSAVSSDLL